MRDGSCETEVGDSLEERKGRYEQWGNYLLPDFFIS